MPWLRLDDGFYTNSKLLNVGPNAKLLYIWALGFAAHELTDGLISKRQVASVSALAGIAESDALSAAEELVDFGLWELDVFGYRIHDYLTYNPSRADVLLEREKAKARMALVRRSGELRPNVIDPVPGPGPGPVPGSVPGSDPNNGVETHVSTRKKRGKKASIHDLEDEPSEPKAKPHAEQFTALVKAFKIDTSRLTPNERVKVNVAAANLSKGGYSDWEIAKAVETWPKCYPSCPATPLAISNNMMTLMAYKPPPPKTAATQFGSLYHFDREGKYIGPNRVGTAAESDVIDMVDTPPWGGNGFKPTA